MPDHPLGLSPRQIECLQLAAELRTSKEIGAKLGLSPNTVDSYIREALATLGVADRAAAARLIMAQSAQVEVLIPSHVAPHVTPQRLRPQSSRVEDFAAAEAMPSGHAVMPATQLGRRVDLGPWTRIGIVFGIAAASIFAVVLLMVAGDVIARRHNRPAVVTTANR